MYAVPKGRRRGHLKVNTAFLRTYNATFGWIEQNYGCGALEEYWKTIAPFVAYDLIEYAQREGIQGCAKYWRNILSDEGVQFILDVQNNERLTLDITDCASIRKLQNPCASYCRHCDVIYRSVLEPMGFRYYWKKTGERSCQIIVELSALERAGKPGLSLT